MLVFRHRDEHLLAVAPNQQERRSAGADFLQFARDLRHGRDLLTVDLEDHVARDDAGVARGALAIDVADDGATLVGRQIHATGEMLNDLR